MPVNIETMTSDVAVFEGELPLNQQQIEKLVQLVLARVEAQKRIEERGNEATRLRHQSAPAMWHGEQGQ